MHVALLESPYTRIITDSNGEVGTYEYREVMTCLLITIYQLPHFDVIRVQQSSKRSLLPSVKITHIPDLPVRPIGIPTHIIMEDWNPERRLESSGRILMFDEDLEY